MERNGLLLLGASLATGLIVSTLVASRAVERLKADETIQVTGSARRRIRSDQITWTAKISVRANDTKAAYRGLAQVMPKVTAYLTGKGVVSNEVVISSVSTMPIHPRDKDGQAMVDQAIGYVMAQTVQIKSRDVERIEKISREATELINDGIEIESFPPEYHYTKIGDLKIAMLTEAAKDSKIRAEQIASATGAQLGPLRSARMGVIQINSADSTEVSGEGNSDTSSLDKDVISVVASTFALR